MSFAKHSIALLCAVGVLLAAPFSVSGQSLTPPQQLARDIHKALVEINTVTSTGDTLKAAQAMAARLLAAGFPEADVHVLSPAPRKGNLVARLRGTGARKPILLLAHIDVVEARPEDWSTDPFKLIEKDGYLYGRGAWDDKFMAAVFVANLIRYRQEGFRPDRDLIVALDTDEEIGDANTMGIRWLLKNHRGLIDAEFALNEGGGVASDEWKSLFELSPGQPKKSRGATDWRSRTRAVTAQFRPGTTRSTGWPQGLARLAQFEFPFKLNETTRAYFERIAALQAPDVGADMHAIVAPQPDPAAVARLSAAPRYNAVMRTTCVATLLEAGHAINALPQSAKASVNCRILPGEPIEEVQRTLVRVLADEQIAMTPIGTPVPSPPSPLNPEIVRTIEKLSAEFWPGVPVVPTMIPAATDGSFLRNAGIPTYGHSGLATDVDDVRIHGKDERILVKSFLDGHEYLYRLVKALASEAK